MYMTRQVGCFRHSRPYILAGCYLAGFWKTRNDISFNESLTPKLTFLLCNNKSLFCYVIIMKEYYKIQNTCFINARSHTRKDKIFKLAHYLPITLI